MTTAVGSAKWNLNSASPGTVVCCPQNDPLPLLPAASTVNGFTFAPFRCAVVTTQHSVPALRHADQMIGGLCPAPPPPPVKKVRIRSKVSVRGIEKASYPGMGAGEDKVL